MLAACEKSVQLLNERASAVDPVTWRQIVSSGAKVPLPPHKDPPSHTVCRPSGEGVKAAMKGGSGPQNGPVQQPHRRVYATSATVNHVSALMHPPEGPAAVVPAATHEHAQVRTESFYKVYADTTSYKLALSGTLSTCRLSLS
jgi:hypothetical protein